MDSTQYSKIAHAYAGSQDLRTARVYFAEPSFFKELGDVRGLKILDLACGDGRLTRKIIERGAKVVVGIDSEPNMIELAKNRTKDPKISYEVCKVGEMPKIGNFDIITAGFLLHYAKTKEELSRMCEDIYKNLKQDGKFLTINQDPASQQRISKTYGTSSEFMDKSQFPPKEGSEVKITIWEGKKEVCTFYNTFWKRKTYEDALEKAGFRDIRWKVMGVNEEGIKKFGKEYWKEILEKPTIILLEAKKI